MRCYKGRKVWCYCYFGFQPVLCYFGFQPVLYVWKELFYYCIHY